jgi:hypothetical protein
VSPSMIRVNGKSTSVRNAVGGRHDERARRTRRLRTHTPMVHSASTAPAYTKVPSASSRTFRDWTASEKGAMGV